MQTWFYQLADALKAQLHGSEVITLWLSAERSDFARFNHGKVRQPGTVEQRYVRLRLIDQNRQASVTLSLAGDQYDGERLGAALSNLRDVLQQLPEDPHLLYARDVQSSETVRRGRLADSAQLAQDVVRQASGYDLVGIHAQGTLYRAFANSLGQRNWHEADSFNFEWSLYHRADKAVKTSYAGFDWNAHEFSAKLNAAAHDLELLQRAPRRIEPGAYRVYLTPAALDEILGLLCWGGFSAKARATKRSPLLRMQQDERLHAGIQLSENVEQSIAPAFQGDGFIKPSKVALITDGRLGDALVSPRTAKEYGYAHNGAGEAERPDALDLAGGILPVAEALSALDTGLYVSNLWYLNYSDRAAGRITGMTRFATFWVEGGRIVAPVEVMRFDDSIYRLLGANLEALTQERETLLDASTYDASSVVSSCLPGCVLSSMQFTL